MAKKLFALVVAVGMVAGAFLLRARLDEGAANPGSGGDGDAWVLLCATELAAACQVLQDAGDAAVRVQDAGETAAELIAATTPDQAEGFDAWVVPQPWPQIVAEARQREGLAPLGGTPSQVLARSPLVMVAWSERAVVLEDECGGELHWSCVGDAAGLPWADVGGQAAWGPVKPGHAAPSTAVGLLVMGAAVADFLGTADYSAGDLTTDEFRAWFTQLERAVPNFGSAAGSPLQQQLAVGVSAFDIVGTTEAEAVPLLERAAARRGSLTLYYPDDVVTADVVALPLSRDGDLGGLDNAMTTALQQTGWRPAAGTGTPTIPAESGTPSAGVLQALRTTWAEVVR